MSWTGYPSFVFSHLPRSGCPSTSTQRMRCNFTLTTQQPRVPIIIHSFASQRHRHLPYVYCTCRTTIFVGGIVMYRYVYVEYAVFLIDPFGVLASRSRSSCRGCLSRPDPLSHAAAVRQKQLQFRHRIFQSTHKSARLVRLISVIREDGSSVATDTSVGGRDSASRSSSRAVR